MRPCTINEGIDYGGVFPVALYQAARAVRPFILRMFIQIILVFCPIMTGWAADTNAPDPGSSAPDTNRLSVSDLGCSGAGPEYLEAYRSFLNSWATDLGGHSYTSSIPVLRKASQNAQNAAVKLRCLLLLAWAQYLNNSAEEAHTSAMECLTMAKQAVAPADTNIFLLDNLKAFISSNSIVRPADLKKHLNANDDLSALIEDLFYLEKSRDILRQMAALRAAKAKTLLEPRITDESKAQGISAADLEKIKPVLEKKYEKQQGIDFSGLADDVENEYAKMLLDELFK